MCFSGNVLSLLSWRLMMYLHQILLHENQQMKYSNNRMEREPFSRRKPRHIHAIAHQQTWQNTWSLAHTNPAVERETEKKMEKIKSKSVLEDCQLIRFFYLVQDTFFYPGFSVFISLCLSFFDSKCKPRLRLLVLPLDCLDAIAIVPPSLLFWHLIFFAPGFILSLVYSTPV